MPVDEVKARTTATGFVRWQEVFRRRANNKRPEFWYLAQIAFEVMRLRAAWVKLEPWEREKNTVDKWLLDFRFEKPAAPAPPPKPPEPQTEEQKARRLSVSKTFWGAVLGRKIN